MQNPQQQPQQPTAEEINAHLILQAFNGLKQSLDFFRVQSARLTFNDDARKWVFEELVSVASLFAPNE